MKKIMNACAGLAVAGMLVFVSACANPSNGSSKSTPTLAETVVNELIASLEADATVSASMSRSVSTEQFSAIKAAALAKIKLDGLTDSQSLDKILPSMMEGVKIAVVADTTLTSDDTTKSALFAACAKGALNSLGKEGRQTKISTDVTDVGAAAGVVTAAVVKVAVQVVADSTKVSATVKAVTTASVTVMQTNTVIKAVSSEETIAKTVAKTIEAVKTVTSVDSTVVTGALVEAVVSTVSGTTADETVKTALVKVVVKAAIEADSSTVTVVVKAAATAVASDATTATAAAAAALIEELAKQAAAAAAEAGVTVTAADLAAAADDGVSDAGNTEVTVDTDGVETEVDDVISEVSPVISSVVASANGTVLTGAVSTAGTVVTLTVTATSSDTLTYTWSLVSGPSNPTISAATAAAATVTPDKTGSYVFKVTVKNASGYKSASETVTVTTNFASAASKTAYTEGMTAMAAKNWELAYTKFLAAYSADNTNLDAKMMTIFLKLGHIAVDSSVVSLMKDRIGVADYPSSLTTLFSEEWLSQDWYEEGGSWSSTTDGGLTWTTGTDYYISPMPRLEVPTWATGFFDEEDLIDVDNDGMDEYPAYMFTDLLAINILSKNPNGLNTIIDGVLSGVYGTNFSSVISLIDSLPATASVTIPATASAALSGSSEGEEIVIHKAELKLVSSSLRVTKSFIQLLASYNLNYPLAFMQHPLWTTTGGNAVRDALLAQDNPFKTGFMTERSSTNRIAAKTSMLNALSDLDQAVVLAVDILDDSTTASYAAMKFIGSATGLSDDEIAGMVSTVRGCIAEVSSVIDNNSAVYAAIDPKSSMFFSDISLTDKDGYVEAHPAAFYATDILNPARLLKMNTAGTGVVLYVVDSSEEAPTYTLLQNATLYDGESVDLAVKVSLDRAAELADMSSMLEDDGDGYAFVSLPAGLNPDYLDFAGWLASVTVPALTAASK